MAYLTMYLGLLTAFPVPLRLRPQLPRKLGRVKGTFELVAHENYLVILETAQVV